MNKIIYHILRWHEENRQGRQPKNGAGCLPQNKKDSRVALIVYAAVGGMTERVKGGKGGNGANGYI